MDTHFVLIDVCEDVKHSAHSQFDFSKMSSSDIITHIHRQHRQELLGLLTLYPFEWPYRDPQSFDRIAGGNIAIDTDDLVLVSDNVALVFGTYGLRGVGSPTDWQGYLRERRSIDHVSWPECAHIVELAVAQLHTINFALFVLQSTASDASGLDRNAIIQLNSSLALRLGQMITDMDAVRFSRYASHKSMHKEIARRLAIAEDLAVLMASLGRVDTAIKNLAAAEDQNRSRMVRLLLGFITIASVFAVLFQDLRLPIVEAFWGHRVAKIAATDILALVGLGLALIGGGAVLTPILRLAMRMTRRSASD